MFAVAEPQYRPDPDRVRRRLERILGDMRAEEKMVWDFSQRALFEKIFPDMTRYLPDEEGARYRAAFEAEWERLSAAAKACAVADEEEEANADAPLPS
jgi:hypothetical protein